MIVALVDADAGGASNAGTGLVSALLSVFCVLPKPYIAKPCQRMSRLFPQAGFAVYRAEVGGEHGVAGLDHRRARGMITIAS